MKSEELIDKGVTVADPARLDVRGEVVAGKDCIVDVNVIFEQHFADGKIWTEKTS
jgi:bifunctional UDP-N-acetylglucosamine pyrophosphorylase/glucosamine-1-phosphate N-acetyltransferase